MAVGRICFVCFALTQLFALQAFAEKNEAQSLAGSWELVSGRYLTDENKWLTSSEAEITSLKILNDSHYSYVSYGKGKFWAAGNGTYAATDRDYTERPIYVSYPMEKGKQYHFQYSVEGDVWTNRRMEDGKLVEEERWRRIPSE